MRTSTNSNVDFDEEVEDDLTEVEVEDDEFFLKKRIISLLTIYPRLSPSMLQCGLGPHIKSLSWRPVLKDLINNNIVEQDQESHRTERGRYKTCIIISLTEDYKTRLYIQQQEASEQDI